MGASALFASGTAIADVPLPARDPFQLYGNEILFDVERDGELIGQHIVTFTRTTEGVRVDSRADVEVDLLFLSAYRLRHQAHELWSDGELKSVEASTNENGDYTHVQAVRDAAGMVISSSEGTFKVPAILPTSHWNAALLKGGPLLNTLTGKLSDVRVFYQGFDTVTTRGGSLRARRYLYSGDLNGEIWFDDEGRWVKLRFRTKDGSIINYVCRRCQGPTTLTEVE
ncbi:DUF6134 family protein [Dongia deserti]|uniref:DUF6134 family protein n=1 Tax=Dongia deserti TaxID=2268030 RepID=UPI000E64E7D7|nr:DUF6134 family protein [Dongia deserti]